MIKTNELKLRKKNYKRELIKRKIRKYYQSINAI